MFTQAEADNITKHGSTIKAVEQQMQQFEEGFPYADLIAPATIGKGIIALSTEQLNTLAEEYEELTEQARVIKFVPASGAASRMFKDLFAFAENFDGSPQAFEEFLSNQQQDSLFYLFNNLDRFAFFDELTRVIDADNQNIGDLIASKEYGKIAKYILETPGLNYGKLPKGLIQFHRYEEECRMAFEEHLVEGYYYANNGQGANIHFTVSSEHLPLFKEQVAAVAAKYKKEFKFAPEVSFSIQKPSTDTIAATIDNKPFKEPNGDFVFRPGGHGALIENLQDLDADIIFIKNIDNIIPDRLKPTTYIYKKACGSLLLQIRNQIFKYLIFLDADKLSEEKLEEMYHFALVYLNIENEDSFAKMNIVEKADFLYSIFNRPLRICGMVKNEGEPGGGPFWVKNSLGDISLQIVEGAQINKDDKNQKDILEKSTHFNPVDLICSIVDHKGKKFDLKKFIDPDTGFISEKSKNGKKLKALELPGLWNGAMGYWNTIFIEVPLLTFNPVKTVNDLLREQHQ